MGARLTVAASFHSCRAAAPGALDMQIAVGCKHHHVFDDAALCFDLVRLALECKERMMTNGLGSFLVQRLSVTFASPSFRSRSSQGGSVSHPKKSGLRQDEVSRGATPPYAPRK